MNEITRCVGILTGSVFLFDVITKIKILEVVF